MVSIVAASTTTKKTSSGRGAKTMANAAAPPARMRTKTACHRRQTGICGSDLWNKEPAGGIHPPPFAGPDNDNPSRQQTGNDKKESRWLTKKQEDRSGWSTTAVGCGKSRRWTARRVTKEGGGSSDNVGSDVACAGAGS